MALAILRVSANLRMLIAVFLSVAIILGPLPSRIWLRSSSNVTSLTQRRPFSMIRWPRSSVDLLGVHLPRAPAARQPVDNFARLPPGGQLPALQRPHHDIPKHEVRGLHDRRRLREERTFRPAPFPAAGRRKRRRRRKLEDVSIGKTPEQILAGAQTQFPVGAVPVPLPADQSGRLPPDRSRMLGHCRPDPGDLPGSELSAVEADGLRSSVTALFAPVIHPCMAKSPEERRRR